MREVVALGIGAGVLAVGGLAYALTRSSATPASSGAAAGGSTAAGATGPGASSSSSSSSTSSSSTTPPTMPQGLVSSGKTATGWAMTIEVVHGVSGLIYQGFLGDVLTVKLPAGYHWRQQSGTGNSPLLGPATGIDDFVFTLVQPMTYELAYMDDARANQVFSFDLEFGGTFQATTSLATGDYVILAVAQKDLEQVVQTITNLYSNLSAANAQPVYGQEAATVVEAANAIGQKNMTPALLLTYVMSLGPWAQSFAPDVHSFVPFNVGTALPSWWPSDDTAAASEYHVLYRYIGPGIDVSALPFPAQAWKRVL